VARSASRGLLCLSALGLILANPLSVRAEQLGTSCGDCASYSGAFSIKNETGKTIKCRAKALGVKWLGEIPAHWEVKRLKHLALDLGSGIQMGPFGSMLKELGVSDTGYKLYGQENTISGDFEKGSRWLIERQYHDLRGYWLRAGDIVVTRKGSIGNARLLPNGFAPGVIDSDPIWSCFGKVESSP
jgi:hypothetical protein